MKYNQYGIQVIYVTGQEDIMWYFLRSHRDKLLFDMRRRPEVKSVKPRKRKVM